MGSEDVALDLTHQPGFGTVRRKGLSANATVQKSPSSPVHGKLAFENLDFGGQLAVSRNHLISASDQDGSAQNQPPINGGFRDEPKPLPELTNVAGKTVSKPCIETSVPIAYGSDEFREWAGC